jgi:DNA-binding CsgD family transcriptional regulator
VLEPSQARLEHARALCDLGAALRRAGRRRDAQEPLRRALDLADRGGALRLAARAREELRAAGARPRRAALTGPAALTAAEQRVTALAAAGHTNREIAQQLFVTQRTVETHLGHAFQKLDIRSREQLAAALWPVDEGAALVG